MRMKTVLLVPFKVSPGQRSPYDIKDWFCRSVQHGSHDLMVDTSAVAIGWHA